MSRVREVEPTDAATWLRLRCQLWPEGSEAEHRSENLEAGPGRESWVVGHESSS